MSYMLAWAIALGAGLLGAVSLFFLTRGIATGWLRNVLRWLPPILLLVPSPVPGYSGSYAPAFVVFVFESLFQTDGRPLGALVILLAAAALSILLILFGSRMGKPKPVRENDSN